MKCPFCGAVETTVAETRLNEDGDIVRRRRRCLTCDKRFSTYEHAEIRHIANEAKSIPREWINDAGNDVTQPLIDYLSPLILGEVPVKYENGIPVYMDVSHLAKHQ